MFTSLMSLAGSGAFISLLKSYSYTSTVDYRSSSCASANDDYYIESFDVWTASSQLSAVDNDYKWSRCTGYGMDGGHVTAMETCSTEEEYDFESCTTEDSYYGYSDSCNGNGDGTYTQISCPSTLLITYHNTEAGCEGDTYFFEAYDYLESCLSITTDSAYDNYYEYSCSGEANTFSLCIEGTQLDLRGYSHYVFPDGFVYSFFPS